MLLYVIILSKELQEIILVQVILQNSPKILERDLIHKFFAGLVIMSILSFFSSRFELALNLLPIERGGGLRRGSVCHLFVIARNN